MQKLCAKELVAAVAGPREWSDTRESWLARAARRTGISFRTVRSIFYGQIDKPDHPCVRLLQAEAERRLAALASRYEHLARSLDTTDPDFYREDAAALVDMARRLRGPGGAVCDARRTRDD